MTDAAMPDARLISDWIEHWAEATPDARALTFEGTTWTWREFGDRIARLRGALVASGIRSGDVVAVLDKNVPPTLELIQAAAGLGAAAAVVNWRLAPEEVAYILGDCAPRMVFVGEAFAPTVQGMLSDLPSVERVVVIGAEGQDYEAYAAAGDPIPAASDVDPLSTATILYTSGTTGFPKGAMLTHAGLIAHTENMARTMPMSEGDCSMVAMPLFHVGGSSYALVGFAQGSPTTLIREVEGAALVGAVASGCTHAFIVPAVIAGVLQAGEPAVSVFGRLKFLYYGASPCPAPVLRAALAAWPNTNLLQVYGMTEMCGVVTTLSPEAHKDQTRPERLASAGQIIDGVELRVVDPATLVDVAPGEPGELWFRSGQIMGGYFGKPDATAAAITDDGWLRSGDVGRVDDGGFIFIEDRVKDMIITGGENVYGPEVERIVIEHPAVAEAAVIGIPHDVYGEQVKAVVSLKPGESLDEEEFLAYCRSRLAGYKVPRSVDIIEALPRNATGKVLKTILRRPYWEDTGRAI